MDEPDPTKGNADVNLGLKKPASFRSQANAVNIIGRLHGDTFNEEKYLMDMVKVRF